MKTPTLGILGKHTFANCEAMATLTSLRQLSVVVCLLLMPLMFPGAHLQLGLVLEHEKLAKMLRVRSAKVSKEVTKHLSAQGFSTVSVERLEQCTVVFCVGRVSKQGFNREFLGCCT